MKKDLQILRNNLNWALNVFLSQREIKAIIRDYAIGYK